MGVMEYRLKMVCMWSRRHNPGRIMGMGEQNSGRLWGEPQENMGLV